MPRYVNALCRELDVCAAERLKGSVQLRTLYIGGGTPTVLPAEEMERILDRVRSLFSLTSDAECTIEANPGTVTKSSLERLHSAGMNRISFGVQSFSDAILKGLGRVHMSEEARDAILLAQEAGFLNTSLDLMYGLPSQTMEDLERSVEEALTLPVSHISVYGLQVEAGTPFYTRFERGQLALPADETVDAMYDYLTKRLPAAGYSRYEISNYAREGFESRHNLSYWQDVPYLGVGASAHSYLGNVRYENVREAEAYIECVESGQSPRRIERKPDQSAHMEEVAFLSLRMAEGLSKARFEETFGVSLEEVYRDAIERCTRKGLLEETKTHIRLNSLGMKYGNQVFAEFLL